MKSGTAYLSTNSEIKKLLRTFVTAEKLMNQARVQGGTWAPPPLEIEKQKKKVIRANFKLFHLYFATFLVDNIIFSAPPPKN